jgi:hypothetical protein
VATGLWHLWLQSFAAATHEIVLWSQGSAKTTAPLNPIRIGPIQYWAN